MTDGLHMQPKHRQVLEALLRKYLPGVEVWAYGSRVSGRSHDGSDLDLVLRGPGLKEIPSGRLGDFEDAVRESTIPFLVEARDWSRLPERFHQEIERHHVVLAAGDGRKLEGKSSGVACEWVYCTLADACSAINYGLTASASNDFAGPKFLRITDIVSGQLDWNTVPHVKADDEIMVKYRLHDGDIVIARTGASTGMSTYVKPPPRAVFASYLVRLQAKPDFDARFLAYYLKSEEFWKYIRGVLGDKSAQPNASASTMTAAPLRAPKNKADQRAIAHILGTLDDKIELNRRMNETLEAMARALFKSWFVDFDPVRAKMAGRDPGLPQPLADLFPDRLVDSELGEIPEGWEVKSIEDIAERVAMGPFGSSIKVATFVEAGVPVISGQHLNGTLLDDNEYRFITNEHAARLAKANVQRGDVIFTHRGNIGQVSYVPKESQFDRYVVSQSQFYMRCDVCKISPLFVVYFFKTTEGQHQLLANTSSTGVPSISRPVTNLRSIRLCIPPSVLWQQFDEFVEGLHLKVAWNTAQSNILALLRDTLLPKLISGELRLKQ